MTENMLKDREELLNNLAKIEEQRRAKYTCIVCNKENVDWNDVLTYSYVYDNKGSITRWGHEDTEVKICSEECRKIAVPRYYDSYDNFIEDVDIPAIVGKPRISDIHRVVVRDALNNYLKYLSATNKGIYLYGNIGCGKTFAACALAYELRKRDKTVLFVSMQEIILKSNNMAYDNKQIDRFIKKYSFYDFLILDDADNTTSINNNAKSILFMLFSKIYNENKKIIVTSNFYLSEVFNCIDERITSRMKQTLIVLDITDKDKRVMDVVEP